MSGGVWLRRLCAALMEDRWEGRQDGGVKTHIHAHAHVHVVCYFGERWPRVHWFSILGMGLVVYLCCFVQFTLYGSKRSVSVKLYQISLGLGLQPVCTAFRF